MQWQGAHVVVTGGSSGIGEATALAAARRRARVTLIARDVDGLDEAAKRIRTAAPGAVVAMVSADVADREAVTAALDRATADRGPVDVLVCSAGITRPGRFLELDDDVFRSMMEVDYFGTLWPVRHVAPSMVERRCGSIIGLSSAAGLVGVYGYSAYGAAKFAVRGLFESLRTELVPYEVHVGCVFPPDVDTPMLTGEEAHKPPETRAIAGAIKALSAEQVAQSIMAGIDARRAEIYPDMQTRALARTASALPGLYRTLFDRKVREAR